MRWRDGRWRGIVRGRDGRTGKFDGAEMARTLRKTIGRRGDPSWRSDGRDSRGSHDGIVSFLLFTGAENEHPSVISSISIHLYRTLSTYLVLVLTTRREDTYYFTTQTQRTRASRGQRGVNRVGQSGRRSRSRSASCQAPAGPSRGKSAHAVAPLPCGPPRASSGPPQPSADGHRDEPMKNLLQLVVHRGRGIGGSVQLAVPSLHLRAPVGGPIMPRTCPT